MKTNLTVQLVKVTPELAENYLKFNVKNRKVSDKQLYILVKEMKNNNFLENGESIVFDKYGELKDGQHRLLAIVKSGKSYHIPVVRGVEPVSMATYDTGKNRSAGDVLTLNGYKFGNQIASFIGSMNKYATKKSKSMDISRNTTDLSNKDILEFCNNNYDWMYQLILKSNSIYSKQQNPKPITLSQLSLMSYIIGGKNPNSNVYSFLKELSGVLRNPETATSYLYTKLYNSKLNKEPLNFYWVLGMAIKAWNYYSDGNPSIKYFKFDISKELPTANKIINI